MLLRVNHISRYRYDQPVIYALQQLRLTPKERAGQKILNWDNRYRRRFYQRTGL